MLIRKTLPEDVDTILNIFDTARQFMHATGNPTQWNANYPALEDLEPDIQNGNNYVCEKLRRQTFMPASYIAEITSFVQLDGPNVHTIFVFFIIPLQN